MYSMIKSDKLHERALQVMPGPHSNLPGMELFKPIYLTEGKGPYLYDVDGNEYFDFMGALGAGILGYQHKEFTDMLKEQIDKMYYLDACRRNPLEVELAEKLVQNLPSVEKVRYLLSGTEVDQLVIRLARAFTGRNLFIRFDGHYHGWLDNVLGGNASVSRTEPPYGFEKEGDIFRTLGRAPGSLEQSFKIPWNDIEYLEFVVGKYGEQIALIIMEPINCNGGVCWPKKGYLERVRELCDEYGIVLCFDEVITNTRLGLSGAQGVLGVIPDLTSMAKAFASGIPFAALGGRADIMDLMLERKVISAGTFNGYPLGVAAALSTIKILEKDDGALYKKWDNVQAKFTKGLNEIALKYDEPMLLQEVRGCIFWQFTELKVAHNMGEWMKKSDHEKQERLRSILFQTGALVIFRGRWYFNSCMTDADVDKALILIDAAMKKVCKG